LWLALQSTQGRDWRLSPGYDLTPTTPVSLERRDLALVIGDAGLIATAENLVSQSARFLLKTDEAAAIVMQMEHQVRATWYDVARGAGLGAPDCALISGAFVYPGFRPNPPPSP
jgi:serine/threonine-protein kinase HipA